MTEPQLDVRNLKKFFKAGSGILGNITLEKSDGLLPTVENEYIRAVDGISFDIRQGETVGLVGESGCGKSTVARAILHISKPTSGEIRYEGVPIGEMDTTAMQELRQKMQIIFQNPQRSLNPRKRIGQIIGRPLEMHDLATGEEKRNRVRELLEQVGLPSDITDKYPHELSGGQQQRIAIARALAVEPELIICDEPVSALDVSVQAQILNLLSRLQEEFGISYLLISHDMSVIRYLCDRVAVMYLGKIVEKGQMNDVFASPYHPYTESLLSSIPKPDPTQPYERIPLEGSVPSPVNPPTGCRFHPRCPKKIGEVCEQEVPELERKTSNRFHEISCHLSLEKMNDTFVEAGDADDVLESQR